MREVTKVQETQRHFIDSAWTRQCSLRPRGCILRPATARGREAANARARLWNQLPEHANPCPDACV